MDIVDNGVPNDSGDIADNKCLGVIAKNLDGEGKEIKYQSQSFAKITIYQPKRTESVIDNEIVEEIDLELEKINHPSESSSWRKEMNKDMQDLEKSLERIRFLSQSPPPNVSYVAYNDQNKKRENVQTDSDEEEDIGGNFGKTNQEEPDEKLSETYKCRFCAQTYNSQMTLNVHESGHENTFVCIRCGLSFRYYSELQTHILANMTNDSNQTCK